MTPIQQLFLGVGASEKTYLDDVFSTYIYNGTGSSGNAISNGINLSEEGGLVWVKNRGTSGSHILFDSEIGDKYVRSNNNNEAPDFYGLGALNSSGFTVGGDWGTLNASGENFSSWSFRKAPGFFDVVTYTGNGTSGRTVNHSLGCVPGCIIIKRTSGSANWAVFHRDIDTADFGNYSLSFNETNARWASSTIFNNTKPTSTQFTLGNNERVNTNGSEYVAYLFANGSGDSVAFDGSGDYLTVGSSSEFSVGTGNFTIECWVKFNETSNNVGIFQISDTSSGLRDNDYNETLAVRHTGSAWGGYGSGSGGSHSEASGTARSTGQWYHVAYVRSSGTTKLYVDGVEKLTFTDGHDYDGTHIAIGGYYSSAYLLNGNITNFRVITGTALYTSAFTPPKSPLATTGSTTKLLCCNQKSITGSTVTSATIVSSGNPTASTASPFGDSAANVFGENKDQNLIKTGSYVGNGAANGPEINLGWEPQWVMIKNANTAGYGWFIVDSMRGIVSDGADKPLYANTNAAEYTESDGTYIDLTSKGFKITSTASTINNNNDTILYIAIRRPDGYVGKPAEAGTDVFTMDVGDGVAGIPDYDSNFPVDFALARKPAAVWNNEAHARLIGAKYLFCDANNAEAGASQITWDSNVGWHNSGANNTYQSWMWKRHAGFDVVAYKGDGVAGKQILHSLGKTPEMVWVKNKDSAASWPVWHKALNGGTNSYNYHILLDVENAEVDDGSAGTQKFHSATPPTSTSVSVGGSSWTNADDAQHIMMLFASVDGISKCGSWTGNGSASSRTITLGFQPRFLLLKRTDDSGDWLYYDSVRNSGQDLLRMQTTQAQSTWHVINFETNGFEINTDSGGVNGSGGNYLYYAHA